MSNPFYPKTSAILPLPILWVPAGAMRDTTTGRMRSPTGQAPVRVVRVTPLPRTDEAQLRSLVARIAAGDQTALGELYDATAAKLYGVARAILKSTHDAEEATCDAYAQVWHEAGRYDATRASVLGWLSVICRARAVDLLRRRKVRVQAVARATSDAAEQMSPAAEELLQSVQEGTRVHRALSQLPETPRRLIAMAFLQDLSHDEIATAMQMPMGTVKSHIRRGLAAMREAMQAEDAP